MNLAILLYFVAMQKKFFAKNFNFMLLKVRAL